MQQAGSVPGARSPSQWGVTVSDGQIESGHEGSLKAPTRHALGWQEPQFYDSSALQKELERVFDICHGCRRCFNLCNAFPTLFDAVDGTAQGEVAGGARGGVWRG